MKNPGKIRFAAFLLAIVATLLLSSCGGMNKVRNLRFTSFRIVSFSPRGLRSADAVLKIGISNPSDDLIVRDLEGVVRKNGTPLARLTGEDVLINGPKIADYTLPCVLALENGVSVVKLIGIIGEGDFSAYTADVTFRLTSGGTTRKVKIKKLKLSDIIR